MRIISSKNLTNGEVLEILEDLKARTYELDQLALRVEDYVRRFNKCKRNKELVEELINRGFKEITATLIANIAPQKVEELRALTTFEAESLPEERLKEVLSLISSYCE